MLWSLTQLSARFSELLQRIPWLKDPYTAQYNETYFERIRLSVKEMFGSNPVRMAPVEMEVSKTIQTI